MSDAARNLLITGGATHPFGITAPLLAAILEAAGFASTVTEDVEGGAASLTGGGYDLLTLYCLRWRMLEPRFEADRAALGMSLSQPARTAIAEHVARGGGLLAVHTAVICFDDWPGYKALLGGVWSWGHSSHPPLGESRVEIVAEDHPITRGLAGFDVIDEIYGGLDLVPDLQPLAIGRSTLGGDWQPTLWARSFGKGRVACSLLGHDARSFANPGHRALLERAAAWAGLAGR